MTIDERLEWEVSCQLAEIFPTYCNYLPHSFFRDVIDDVKAASAYPEDFDGVDISLAIQRVIVNDVYKARGIDDEV